MADRIALVDDDQNILTSVALALESEGFEVDSYNDGETALAGLSRRQVDLAVLVKNQKKQYITPENIMSIMLNQIPGISTNSSLAICSKFKNIESLINCIKNNPEELSEIYLTNNRKISKTIIENLSKYLVI